jgi:hypothetical protein
MRKTKSAPKNPHAQALGVLGGSRNTPAQEAARAANAKLAGRPRRICTACGEHVFGGHKERAQDKRCDGRTWTWQKQTEKRAAAATAKVARRKRE